MNGQEIREFFARHKFPEDRHVIRWCGLPLDEMTKAELRIVIDNCCADMEKFRERASRERKLLASPDPNNLGRTALGRLLIRCRVC